MSDTELLIRDCLASYAEQAELADLVHAAKSRSRKLSQRRGPLRNKRLLAVTVTSAVAVLIGTAFVLGGHQSSTVRTASLHRTNATGVGSAATDFGVQTGRQSLALHSRHNVGPVQDSAAGRSTGSAGVTGERVVKTGSMSLTVRKGAVQSAVSELVGIATRFGGYVSQTHTEDVAGSPTGEVTLRMPVDKFESTITAAQKVGHQTALTTSAHDVTGKFVDLGARLSALKQTRQTYLTILSRAHTIGQTLSVQQRVEDIQQQIERTQGSLKVLRNQSRDGTLTVDVAEAGSATAAPQRHDRSGISKAWHDSVSRFARGFDAIVGALGPLLLAAILLGLAYLLIRLGLRRTRRATS